MDNACGASDIAELFVSKYEQLFTSVPTSQFELKQVHTAINDGIRSNDTIDDVYIPVNAITKCVDKLKAGKSDGGQGFDSDHLINGTPKLFNILCMLFNCMIRHGYTANDLLYSSIVSIPKNMRGSLCSSDNYRGIALCCSVCKVIDMVIMDLYGKYLQTSDLQFGFKPGHSTTLCTAVYLETVDYYVRRNTDVYSCLLDASKAFDKVHYGKLFKLLISRCVPFPIIRLLFDSYTRQQVSVSWGSAKSRFFGVTNGVKQGGVLSPILFIVYIDELITLLSKSDIGCHIGPYYVGALGYADDVTLISPSLQGLNEMLSICKSFAEDFNVTFNAKKTMCIKFGSPVTCYDKVNLDGCVVKWVDQVKHLGNTINVKRTDTSDCDIKRHVFNGAVNKLIGNYGALAPDILCKLFSSYCCSFYGSQLWDLNSIGFHSCCVQWNKAVRRILNLPYRSHTWLLGPMVGQAHISAQLAVKTLRFINSIVTSSNSIVSYFGIIAKCCATSPIGRNLSYLKYKYHIDLNNKIAANVKQIYNSHLCTPYQQSVVENVKNLLDVKNGVCDIDGFNSDMIKCMLESSACD